MIHTSGITRVLALLNTDATHIAIGSGSAPTVASTQLTTETLRKAITTSLIDGNALVKEVFIDESEGNGTITELGLFVNGATISAGSGQLLTSGTAALLKDNTQSLTISFEIEVKEVV